MTSWLMVVHHNTKFGYKSLQTNKQLSSKQICVTSITSLTPEDTTVLSLF